MKTIVICGDHPRNYQIVKKLIEVDKINLKKVILLKREDMIPKAPSALSNEIKKLWYLHFEKRSNSENKYFNYKISDFLESDQIININNIKELKNNNIKNQLLESDVCFLSGIPIIGEEILKFLPAFTINLHMGLIPYYKGSITMFWPFYFLEPNMAGTTFHIIDKYVDTGEILHNNTPNLERGDGLHDVASKAIVDAANDIGLVVDHISYRIKNNKMPIKDPQLRFKGKLFTKSDWKPEMLKIIYELYEDKIVDLYLDKKIVSKKPILKKL